MAGPDLEIVGLGLEALDAPEQRPRRRFHRALDPRGALEQVGPSHVAHEDEVAGDRSDRLGRRGAVGDEEGEVLRRVPRRMQRLDPHATHVERVPVAERNGAVARGEVVAPVVAALVGEVERRLCPGGELAAPGDEVGVNVGLGDVGDAEVERGGEGEILLDVAGGVDHERLPRLGTADEVSGLGELRVPDAVQQH